jgi:pimeloyl-ACP methyl ester carboxylesterase
MLHCNNMPKSLIFSAEMPMRGPVIPPSVPIVLIPGLSCSARLYAAQIPALWRFGPVAVAAHTRDDTVAAIARRILDDAPPRFALAALSMGGYMALEIMRQAPNRVDRLALLDTNARDDSPEAQEKRRANIALAESGRFDETIELVWPLLVYPDRRKDAVLKQIHVAMCHDVGAEAYVRQQRAILARPDSRPLLPTIKCPTLVLVGEQDELTPPVLSEEIAAGIPGAKLVKVPHCGHLSTLEQPEAVNAALVEWMRM